MSILLLAVLAVSVVPSKAEAVKAVESYLADVQGEKVEIVRAFPPVSLKGTLIFRDDRWQPFVSEDRDAAVQRVQFRAIRDKPIDVDAVFVFEQGKVALWLYADSIRFRGESERQFAVRLNGRQAIDNAKPRPINEVDIARRTEYFREQYPDESEDRLRKRAVWSLELELAVVNRINEAIQGFNSDPKNRPPGQ